MRAVPSHHPQGYQTLLIMSPFVPPLISLFFFSSFAVAAIYAPDCSLTWLWVRILSFPHSSLWLLTDLVAFLSSHSILSGKMRVQLRRSCYRHALGAVSCLFVVLSCIGTGREHYLFQRTQSMRYRRDTTTLAHTYLTATTCVCAASSHIRS